MSSGLRIVIAALLGFSAFLLLPSISQAAPPAGACIGTDACTGNTGGLQVNACVGERACFDNSGNINKNACHDESACERNTGAIGDGACLGWVACAYNDGNVSKGGCVGPFACGLNTGAVGEGGCVGTFACSFNTGAVGLGACHGDQACRDNSGNINNNACHEESACELNTGAIGDGGMPGLRSMYDNTAMSRRGAVSDSRLHRQHGGGGAGGLSWGRRVCCSTPAGISKGACDGISRAMATRATWGRPVASERTPVSRTPAPSPRIVATAERLRPPPWGGCGGRLVHRRDRVCNSLPARSNRQGCLHGGTGPASTTPARSRRARVIGRQTR